MIAAEHLPQQFNVATWFVDRNIDEGRGSSPAFRHEGIDFFTQKRWARKAYFVGIGALFIAVINAIAYYGDRGYIGLVIFFIAVAVAGVFFAMRVEE